jgi:hypothetical protein
MAMTITNKKVQPQKVEIKSSTLITSDMVLDLYDKAKKTKGAKKKNIMEKVVFLSQHLNRYTPIVVSQYLP